jgi:hypothetical protein
MAIGGSPSQRLGEHGPGSTVSGGGVIRTPGALAEQVSGRGAPRGGWRRPPDLPPTRQPPRSSAGTIFLIHHSPFPFSWIPVPSAPLHPPSRVRDSGVSDQHADTQGLSPAFVAGLVDCVQASGWRTFVEGTPDVCSRFDASHPWATTGRLCSPPASHLLQRPTLRCVAQTTIPPRVHSGQPCVS